MKIGILTGGGDTQAVNAILYGAAFEATTHQLVGFEKGWHGVVYPMELKELTINNINRSKGGTILKSSRTKLAEDGLSATADNLNNLVDALIAIGGDDTLSVGSQLIDMLNIPIVLVTKTIDNDVGKNAPNACSDLIDYTKISNYFNPGFATAAKKASRFARDLKTTAYSHERIMLLETMGRSPGWLALSSYEGKPDFIIVPEVGLNFESFKELLAKKYAEQGYAIIAVAEGARYEGQSNPISEDKSNIDKFGHKKLGGVAEVLAARVKDELQIENSNGVNPGYLYRSGAPTKLDKELGIALGRAAVKAIQQGKTGYVAVLSRVEHTLIAETKPLNQVIEIENGKIMPRNLDLRFYNPITYSITSAGIEYFKPIFHPINPF